MMKKEENLLDLNKIIHERIRLGIMSALSTRETMTFTELKELLNATDGNLSVHARILEDNSYIKSEKDFVNRKPLTIFKITPKGKKEFMDYLAKLKEIIKQST
jgi:DNA-binding MarR family transcriptional regulator